MLLSYEELLEVFWNNHNPTRRPWSQQYKSAVFYHNDEQKKLAVETRDRQATKLKGKLFKNKIHTEIIPASEFYLAEDYHQKYLLQNTSDLMKEYKAIYPNPVDFVGSTAVARVNGFVGGYSTIAALEAVLNDLGLSVAGSRRLQEIVHKFGR